LTSGSSRGIDLVKGAGGTVQVAGLGSAAWIGRHGGSCLLGYQHLLCIWVRIHGQNGLGEKHGRVSLSRLSGRRSGERYGVRVGKAKIGRGFQKELKSAGVE